jgi:hypothetical protein
VRINDSSMLMARQIAKVVDPAFGGRVEQTMNLLQRSAAGHGEDTAAVARTLQGEMDELVARLDRRNFAEPEMRAVLAGLVAEGLGGQYHDYAGAEQATMAIGSVASFMYRRGLLGSAREVNAGLSALQAAVANDERFRPAEFQSALRNFRGAVGL